MNKYTKAYSPYIRKFEEAKGELQELLSPLEEHLFTRRPSRKSWSAGECISHLVEAGSRYYERVKEGYDPSIKTPDKRDPMHLRLHMRWFVTFLEPPVRFKSPAPASFRPKTNKRLDKNRVLADFLSLQDRYIRILRHAGEHEQNLGDIFVPNPVVPIIQMSVAECIAVTEAHQRRHLLQASGTLTTLKNQIKE